MGQKNTKPQIYTNPFEQVAEIGQRVPQHVASQILDTFNPLKAFDGPGEIDRKALEKEKAKIEKEKGRENFTPVDMQMLEEKYRKQDSIDAEKLKRRLFDLVKRGEEEAIQARRNEEEERRKKEQEEEEAKRKQEEERQAQEQRGDALPKGKETTSIFSKKKKKQVMMENAPERKASKSKQ